MNEQRGPARKPDVRVVAKMKDGSLAKQYVDIGAWWRQEDGKLRGGWDRRVVAVKLDDGTVIQVADAFLNLQETAAQPVAPRRAPSSSAAPPPDDGFGDAPAPRPGASTQGTSGFGGSAKHTAPPDGFGGGDPDDQIPFRQPFTLPI